MWLILITSRIQVFTTEGQFLRAFWRYGDGIGDLNSFHLVSLLTLVMWCMSARDLGHHRVSVFTSEGHFLTSFGEERGRTRRCLIALVD